MTLTTAVLACVVLLFCACSGKNTESNNVATQSKVKVVVTFNAMREFAAAVGKDKVDIVTIIPDGTESHDFEPKAKVFVYNGLGMETWVDKTLQALDNKNIIIVEASKGSQSIENTDSDEIKEHGKYDPHLWISLKGAENEAQNIKDALVKADPNNKDYIQCMKENLEMIYNSLK